MERLYKQQNRGGDGRSLTDFTACVCSDGGAAVTPRIAVDRTRRIASYAVATTLAFSHTAGVRAAFYSFASIVRS